MKKLLFFVAALFTVSLAQAQDGIKLGLKAGANLSTLTSSDDDDENGNKFGFHIGGFLDYGISEMVSIRPELLYSMKGSSEEDSGDDYEFESTTTLHYIDIPVLARINAGNLFFELGPTASFLLSGKYESTYTEDGETEDESETITDDLNKLDFGYAAGIGYQLQNGLGINLRYNGGLSNIVDSDDDDDDKIRNSVFQLSLSYTLGGR